MAEEEKKEKKTFVEWVQEHPKTVFVTRAISWSLFAGILPFVFIAWRYGIFRSTGAIALNGWGVIGLVILAIFVITLFNYLRQGMKHGFFKQCVVGFAKVIVPLVLVMLVVEGIKSNIELFQQALACTIACELVAIPINPFPEWVEKQKREGRLEEQKGVIEALWDKYFSKKKENEDKE